jgi:hypothetical protein
MKTNKEIIDDISFRLEKLDINRVPDKYILFNKINEIIDYLNKGQKNET